MVVANSFDNAIEIKFASFSLKLESIKSRHLGKKIKGGTKEKHAHTEGNRMSTAV